MFTKTTLFKFALVPLAAVTLLAPVVSASPAADIQRRQTTAPGDQFFWPPDACSTGITTLPNLTLPTTNTVWQVGQVRKVRWVVPSNPNEFGDGQKPPCRLGVFLVRPEDRNFRPIVIGTGFSLSDGSTGIDVLVPRVLQSSVSKRYAVVLTFGRLQRRSPNFRIGPV